MCVLHTQLSLSLPPDYGSDSASPPVSPCLASPPSELGCCLSAFVHPLRTALRNELVDAARGFTPLQKQRRLERGFCRELDVFLLTFYSLGVRTRHFGTVGRGRKAAPS